MMSEGKELLMQRKQCSIIHKAYSECVMLPLLGNYRGEKSDLKIKINKKPSSKSFDLFKVSWTLLASVDTGLRRFPVNDNMSCCLRMLQGALTRATSG